MTAPADSVKTEIAKARSNVYRLFPATPLQPLDLSFAGVSAQVWLKREDLSPVHSFKWRGAFHCITQLSSGQLSRGVVTASAGNHAQGVAATAAFLGIHATVFMPVSVPLAKHTAVKKHGGGHVRIVTIGNTYDESCLAAKDYARAHGLFFVHPYDDAAVIGGQGTVADEIARQTERTPPDTVYVPVGGGGLAGATALWLKTMQPKIRVVGVEAQGQHCMSEAFRFGKPTALPGVDTFCDGTAVRQAGELCFTLCKQFLDEIVVVSNKDVCNAIQCLWNAGRIVAEPSGALSIAGMLHQRDSLAGKTVCAIVSGANMDFHTLSRIASTHTPQQKIALDSRKVVLFK